MAATGTARLNVLPPTRYPDGRDYRKSPTDLPYCQGGATVPGQIKNEGQAQYPCQYHDEDFVVPQPVERDALFLTTRVKARNKTLPPGCNAHTRAEK